MELATQQKIAELSRVYFKSHSKTELVVQLDVHKFETFDDDWARRKIDNMVSTTSDPLPTIEGREGPKFC